MRATRWGRVGSAAGLAAVTLGVGFGGGCRATPEKPQPATSASPSVAPARYTGFKDTCPTLTGDAAKALGASGEGHPVGTASSVPGVVGIRCAWRPEGARPSVNVAVSVYPNGFAPTNTGAGNARHLFDDLRTEAGNSDQATTSTTSQQSEWGPAFVTVNAALDSVTQTTLVDNAVVTVVAYDQDRFTDDMRAERDDLLRRLGPAVRTVTGEVVGALR